MDALANTLHDLLQGPGPGLAITGMSIVFAALGLISTCIFLLPVVLARINRVYPEPKAQQPRPSQGAAGEDVRVVAAIVAAVQARAAGHDGPVQD